MSITAAQAIRYRLANTAGVTAVVGANVYLDGSVPQGTAYPYITVLPIDIVYPHHMTASAGLAMPRLQIDVYANESVAAQTIANACRAALDGFRGTVTIGGDSLAFQMCHLDSEIMNVDAPVGGQQTTTQRITQDYLCGHSVSVPTFT